MKELEQAALDALKLAMMRVQDPWCEYVSTCLKELLQSNDTARLCIGLVRMRDLGSEFYPAMDAYDARGLYASSFQLREAVERARRCAHALIPGDAINRAVLDHPGNIIETVDDHEVALLADGGAVIDRSWFVNIRGPTKVHLRGDTAPLVIEGNGILFELDLKAMRSLRLAKDGSRRKDASWVSMSRHWEPR